MLQSFRPGTPRSESPHRPDGNGDGSGDPTLPAAEGRFDAPMPQGYAVFPESIREWAHKRQRSVW